MLAVAAGLALAQLMRLTESQQLLMSVYTPGARWLMQAQASGRASAPSESRDPKAESAAAQVL
jgi:hypothetical protein